MNLLMITRKIDRDDWLAGHSFDWAVKIGLRLQAPGPRLYIICLEKGNLTGFEGGEVYSLGKERGVSRWTRFWRFQKLALKLVPKVDGIFCHQNPEYTIAIWPWAFAFRKKIVSWYTHKVVTWKSRLMLLLAFRVLTASKESFRIPSSKVAIVGHGIDVEKFKKSKDQIKPSYFRIITVGRISPVKDLETLILAIKVLVHEHRIEDLRLDVIGDVGLTRDRSYLEGLKLLAKNAELSNYVRFFPPVPHTRIVEVYQSSDLFVNLSQTGSMDKAVLEAMACEVPVITSNEAFFELLRPFKSWLVTAPNEAKMLASKVLRIKHLNLSDRQALGANLRSLVVAKHDLNRLADLIISAFSA